MTAIPVFFVNKKENHLTMEWMEADACDHVLQVSDRELLITLPDEKKESVRKVPVRTAFHAGKQYEYCYGPYEDLLRVDLSIVEKDPRIHSDRELTGYWFGESVFSPEPALYFYTWLYLKALNENPAFAKTVLEYSAFSDPIDEEKSEGISPAFSTAVFLLLKERQELQQAKKDLHFLKEVVQTEYKNCFEDPVMEQIPRKEMEKPAQFPTAFQVGDVIRHPVFGQGKIIDIKPWNTFAHLTVVFDEIGAVRRLSESWVRLKCSY